WREVLAVPIREQVGSSPAGPRYVVLEPQEANGVALAFQWVPEPKITKNRLHLDVAVEDLEATTALVRRMGGSSVQDGDFEEDGWRWRVMRDPDGNEFCLIP